MKIGRKSFFIILLCIAAFILFLFIRSNNNDPGETPLAQQPAETGEAANHTESPNPSPAGTDASPNVSPAASPTLEPTVSPVVPTESPTEAPTAKPSSKPSATASSGLDFVNSLTVVAEPEAIAVLVNKQYKLPEDYAPDDLVYPDVLFLFEEKIEKRMMRKEAAEALEEMFSAAKDDDIHLAGASAYRSHETQTALFNRYVKEDGLEKALTYSAYPGTSEHETGLAIDVSGSTGKCAVKNCFADTKESDWLKENVFDYGFIIRYPEGKESITGYQYEPWHLRYVGKEVALAIKESGDSLEEYYGAIPVSQP